MNPLRLATAFAVALFGCALVAPCTTVIPPTLDELVERSGVIIRTHVTATRCEWRGEGEERRIVTVVSFAVDENVVGRADSAVELEFLGGELDGERFIVVGQTRFEPGQEDVLFVSRETHTLTPLVRMMYGRYLVAERADGRRLMARANGTPLIALDQIAAPLGQPPTGEALAMVLQADGFTPEQFCDAIRESARQLGRTDVTKSSGERQQ